MDRWRDDSGFTLTELIVALGLLLIVLGMAYLGLQVVYKSSQVSEIQSVQAREIGATLTFLEEIASQNLSIEAPTAYSVQFLTDRNNDDIRERHIISANADKTVVDQIWLVNNLGQNTTLRSTYTWSRNNANRALGVPLFHYYRSATTTSAAVEITNMADVPAKAGKLVIDMRVNYQGKALRDTREVMFRNR
ncbi:MAG: prepilin-type N-terminal cleavage/methylation domain-containing protein [Actinobacteria bacterium]|nr:MAG: prepilin-type N-terminal cleavage/methylation domain-containing protein [Actinomycetota bacterium]